MILKPIKNKEEFAAKAEAALGVFGSSSWLGVYGDALTLVGIYKDERQLIGGFYYLNTRRYGFSFIKLPPYTPHCGLFFISESVSRASANNFSKEVMNAVCDFFTQQKSTLTILAFPWAIIDLQPFVWGKYKVVPNYTYHINLGQTTEEIKSNFDPKNRNAIAKAVKEGVTVQESTLAKEQLFAFFDSTLKAANANVYEKELHHIFHHFARTSNSFSMEAYQNGNLLGVVFCVYDARSCYYLLGGVNKGSGIAGVNNLLVQHSIEKAQQLGCSIFDFEGSMLKGVEKFFRGFGPQLVPYYTVNKGNFLLELLLKFKKRELF